MPWSGTTGLKCDVLDGYKALWMTTIHCDPPVQLLMHACCYQHVWPKACFCTCSECLSLCFDLHSFDLHTTCCNREDDPEPVKRLKREMAVALSEEDYVSAARIRDHPFMKLAVQIIQEKLAGRESEAEALQAELQKVVRAQQ